MKIRMRKLESQRFLPLLLVKWRATLSRAKKEMMSSSSKIKTHIHRLLPTPTTTSTMSLTNQTNSILEAFTQIKSNLV